MSVLIFSIFAHTPLYLKCCNCLRLFHNIVAIRIENTANPTLTYGRQFDEKSEFCCGCGVAVVWDIGD